MFKFLIATRYLKTRLIAVISMIAIACAVVIAYVPNPVMEGFLTELKAKVRGTSADVLVQTRERFDADALAEEALRKDDRILTASPHIEGHALFSTGDTVDTFDYGQVIGVDPEKEVHVSHLGQYLQNAGTALTNPFELKPETLREVIRRERAEAALGLEGVEAWTETAREKALAALARERAVKIFLTPEARRKYVERMVAKGYAPKEAEGLAQEMDRNTARLRERLVAREGRKAFIRLEPEEAERRLAAVTLPEGIESSKAFVDRLREMRRLPGVLVGMSLLANWREIRVGEEIELICAKFSGPMEAQKAPKGRNLIAVIVGAYDSGFYDFDVRTLYMSLADADRCLAEVRPVRGVGFKLKNWRESDAVREALNTAFGGSGFTVTTWKQKKDVLIQAVERQKQVLFVILFFADIVAGFGIFITLRILVAEKVRDIGIFSAIGAGPRSVMSAFVLTGLTIGLAGAAVGVAAGMGIVSLSNEIVEALNVLGVTEFKSYIEEIQHLKRIPVEYRIGTLMKIILWTLVSAFLFSIYPAFLAARMKPVDAIRREFL
ncbi:MAG: ABC transporter permease [Planctomycetota bacterium]|jgi:lipoprotein-releasing system permease protein